MAKKENRHAELVSASANIEAPYELPEGWKWCRQNEVCRLADGEKKTNVSYPYLEVKYLRGNKEKDFVTSGKFIKAGTKVILVDGENSGEVFTVPEDGFMGSTFKALSIQNVDENYLQFFIQTKKDLYRNNKKGSAIPHLNKELFFNMPFPLPPTLAEQQRIVNHIETMFAKLDQAQEKVQAVLDIFETRKAAILHKAFTGELTANWRKENGVPDDSWEEKTVGECCTSLKYGTAKKSESSGKVAVIRMGNIQHGEIEYDDLVFSNDEEDIKKYSLSKGDVLFNRTNSPEWVGKTSIYRGDIPAIYAGYLIKLDYIKTMLIGDYLNYMLNSPNAKEYCNSVKTDGVNQSNINAQKIGAYEIPVPSLPEQQEIVRILDSVLEKESHAKEAAGAVLDQIALLKKSILARAFRGEL